MAEEFKNIKVKKVLEKPFVNTSHATIDEVYNQLKASPQGMVAIVSPDEKLTGVVTNTSLASGLMKEKPSSIDEVMQTTPISINQEVNIGEAIRVMNDSRVDQLPVVDEENKLVGIISREGVRRELNKHLKIKL